MTKKKKKSDTPFLYSQGDMYRLQKYVSFKSYFILIDHLYYPVVTSVQKIMS